MKEEKKENAAICHNCGREEAVGENDDNLSFNLCEKCNALYAAYMEDS